MRVRVHETIDDIDASDWDRLAGPAFPFLTHAFLSTAERSGCVSDETGWAPRHLTLEDASGLVGAMPLYEKTHSWGEFVFDWAWANAYHRAGIAYYPKLVAAVPFTPAPCPKFLMRAGAADAERIALAEAAIGLADERQCSSLHVLFPADDELPVLERAGLRLRKDCQFHWHNRGYSSFDDFLATFNSKKRKKARRDRRHVAESGIRFRHLRGGELDLDLWEQVYTMINVTFLRRGSSHYFSLDFFVELSRRQPDDMLVILAEKAGRPVAAAVCFVGADTLYGRYWGSLGRYNALHFETCYYQGIDFCIREGIRRFEPGTQGEHKVSRGFLPQATHSAHWLKRPEFFAAISDYLELEIDDVERYMRAVDERSPYRQAP